MKSILIVQPRGLGDILFCQKIAKKLIEHKFYVYWNTNDYFWLKDYINHDNLKYINHGISTDYILNLSNSIEENHPYDIMTCKYKMIGKTLPNLPASLHDIDYRDWSNFLKINRNYDKENSLFYDKLGLRDDEEYILINKNYGINQINESVGDKILNEEIKIVYLTTLDDFTLFDWCKVIENSSEIHTVDTSLIYLIEILKLNSDKLYLYPRHPSHIKKCLGNLFGKDWVWVD